MEGTCRGFLAHSSRCDEESPAVWFLVGAAAGAASTNRVRQGLVPRRFKPVTMSRAVMAVVECGDLFRRLSGCCAAGNRAHGIRQPGMWHTAPLDRGCPACTIQSMVVSKRMQV